MDMTTIQTLILVRHGRVHNPNHVVYADLPGFDLDPQGVLEAHATAHRLAARPVDVVVSSPLARALTTARAIAAPHGLDVAIDQNLTEWQLSEQWIGVAWDDLPTVAPGQLEAYLRSPHDLGFARENLRELADRMLRVVESRIGSAASTTVMVSHQDPVSALTLALTGSPLSDLLLHPPEHASVTVLERERGDAWALQTRWFPRIGGGAGGDAK